MQRRDVAMLHENDQKLNDTELKYGEYVDELRAIWFIESWICKS